MKTDSLYIHRYSFFYERQGAAPQELKDRLSRHTNYYVRRVSPFILLSLVGVHECLRGTPVSNDTSVFLTTGNGNLGENELILLDLYLQQSFPTPFHFINAVGNTASFHVAQSLGLLSTNLTLSGGLLSFERGLELAGADFKKDSGEDILIGGVDSAPIIPEAVKHLPGYSEDFPLIQGSSWIYLKRKSEGALGRVLRVSHFDSHDEALKVFHFSASPGEFFLAFGAGVAPGEKEEWKKRFSGIREWNPLQKFGYCDSSTALGVCAFLEEHRSSVLLHVNQDRNGRIALLEVERF